MLSIFRKLIVLAVLARELSKLIVPIKLTCEILQLKVVLKMFDPMISIFIIFIKFRHYGRKRVTISLNIPNGSVAIKFC